MFGAIHHAFRQGMQLTSRLAPPERALGFHRAIYSAIHLRQPEETRRKMAEHLIDAKNLLLQVCLENALSELKGGVARGDREVTTMGA
jgi:DNA-binding FadR family transcriptional regulator